MCIRDRHTLVFRFGRAAQRKAFCVDHDRPGISRGEHHSVAIQERGKHLGRVSLDTAVVNLQDGLAQCICRGARQVGADDWTDDALVDRDVINHAVKEEYRAVQPLSLIHIFTARSLRSRMT